MNTTRDHKGGGPYPPAFFLAALILMPVLHYVVPGVQWIDWPWRLGGIVLGLPGAIMAFLADRQFKKRGTTVVPFEVSSTLVTDGVYAMSRNPMYLGMVLAVAGLWWLLGSLSPLIVIPVFVWSITKRFIKPEEAMLKDAFGDDFSAYCLRVRRWL